MQRIARRSITQKMAAIEKELLPLPYEGLIKAKLRPEIFASKVGRTFHLENVFHMVVLTAVHEIMQRFSSKTVKTLSMTVKDSIE